MTRPRGGEIGWIHRDTFDDPELVEKIFALEVGVISDPILEGSSGYHVMEVMEREAPRPFADVAPMLRDQLQSAEATSPEIELSAKLIKEHTRITVFDDALGE